MTSDVHQCPHCELRFLTLAETEEHLLVDHGVDLRRFEHEKAATPPHRPASR